MAMKKISEEEIEQLHVFVKSRFVEFYDVELEMVDHLAHGIENQWQETPDLSFEKAKQLEFKKFGIFGFVGVIEQKQAQLIALYEKEMWQHLKSFFSIPKIVLTLAIFLSLFAIGFRGGELGMDILYATMIVLFVSFLGVGGYWNYSIKKNRKGKKFLLDSIALKVFYGGALMPIIMQTPNFFITGSRIETLIGLVFLCLVILFMGLWSYIVIFIFKPYFNQALARIKEVYI